MHADPAEDEPPRRPLPLALVLVATALTHAAALGVLLVERAGLRERFPALTETAWIVALGGHGLALLGALGVWRWLRWGLPVSVLAALVLFGLAVRAGLPPAYEALVVLLVALVVWASKPVLRRLL